MNLLLKKQFILEAFDYNNSLDKPFSTSYLSQSDYYIKSNYIVFTENTDTQEPASQLHNSQSIVDKHINLEMTIPNNRKLLLSGDNFIIPYFKHFFIQHKELQLDLLKFFTGFMPFHKTNNFQFLTQFDKKEVEPLLTHINHWLGFTSHNISALNDFMLEKKFTEGFIVSVLKKYVSHNLKNINKSPSLSQDLENFLVNNYSQYIDIISSNVVAIESRFKPVDQQLYQEAFQKNTTYCLTDKISINTLLKTFQIPGWDRNQYSRFISSYHLFISKNNSLEVHTMISQNQKEVEFYIKMKTPDYTLDHYKDNLFVLLHFYRNNSEYPIDLDHFSKVFFNQKLNDSLTPANKKQKANKI